MNKSHFLIKEVAFYWNKIPQISCAVFHAEGFGQYGLHRPSGLRLAPLADVLKFPKIKYCISAFFSKRQ